MASTVSAIAQMYPDIAPAVIITTALAGVPPDDSLWAEIDNRSREVRAERWGQTGAALPDYALDLAEGTWGAMTAVARGGMILFETLWEEALPRTLRTGVLMSQGEPSWQAAWNEASASSGLRATEEFFGDPMGNLGSTAANYLNLLMPFSDPFEVHTESRVNMGTGFFANSDLVEADDERVQQLVAQGMSERDAMVALTNELYGSPSTLLFREGADAVQIESKGGIRTGVSLGRLAAINFAEPGSQPFNLLSGSMDFGAQIFLDPSNVVGGWAGKARVASRAMRQAPEAPGVLRGLRNSVFLTDVNKALDSNMGNGMLEFLSDTTDIALIDGVISPSTRTRGASNELLRQIQVTGRGADGGTGPMREIIRQHTGTEIVRKPWNTSVTSALLGGNVSAGGTVRARTLNQVNQKVNLITQGRMAQQAGYKGFQPTMRVRYMDGSLAYGANAITRESSGRIPRSMGRLFSQMAGETIDVSNVSKGIRQMRDLARNLDLTPEETQHVLNKFVNLSDGDLGGTLDVLESAMSSYRKKLHLAGVSDETITRLTSVYKDQAEMHKYFVNSVGDPENVSTFEMLLGNGEKMSVPAAHVLSEMAGLSVAIPSNPRTIRRMTDFVKRAEGGFDNVSRQMQGKEVRGSLFYDKDFDSKIITMAADGLIQSVWKPMVLMRPAWTLRVVGEEQIRMAAADLHSFNHPGRAFITALTDKNLKLGLTTRGQLYKSDLYGDALSVATDYQQAMSRGTGGWLNSPGGYGAQNWIKVELGSADYDKWWFRELNQLQTDRVSNDIAKMLSDPEDTRNINDIVDSFMDGELASARDELRGAAESMRHKQLADRAGGEAYIQSLEARLHLKTGGRYEVLKDDGWWYDDAGARLRKETSSEGIQSSLPAGKRGVRVKTRSINEYHDGLVRGGKSPDEVNQQINLMYSKGIKTDADFAKLDPDARTVLVPEASITETDLLAEAHALEFRVTQKGDADLINSIATGKLGKADYHGEINGKIESAMRRELAAARERGVTAPQFVKGVEEKGNGALDNMLEKGFSMFMGKQTNRYSRSPAFMRSYWNTVADLADQGLIDPATFNKLETLLTGKGRSVTTEGVRKALRFTDEMDTVVSRVERRFTELHHRYGETDPAIAEALRPTMDRLEKLVKAEHYDVGRYNRIVDDMRLDLNDLNDDLVESLGRALKEEGVALGQRERLVRELQDEIDVIQKELKQLERLGKETDALDDLDIMYEAMGNMNPGYIDGLAPHPRAIEGSTDLESAIQVKMQEIIARDPILSGRQTKDTFGVEGAGGRVVPVETKMVKAGHYTVASPYGETLIRKTGPQKWQVVYPEGMPLPEGVTRRNVYRTKTEADAAIKGQFDTMGQDTAFISKTDGMVPGEVAPMRPVQEELSEIPGEPWQRTPVVGDEVIPQGSTRAIREKKMREDLGYNTEQVNAMEAARNEAIEELKAAELVSAEGRAFDELLPTREGKFISMEEVDSIAKAAALTETRQLLYDLSKRSNFSDMMRNIFPFAEAWWEILTTWSRLIQENPRTLQRFQQAYKGASEDIQLPESAFSVEGHDGKGFFYIDPRTNEEMFAIPWLSDALSGSGTAGAVIGGAVGGGLGGLFGGGFGRGPMSAAVGAGIGAAAGYGVSQAELVPEGESVGLGFSTQALNMATQSAIPGVSPLAAVPLSWVIGVTDDKLQQPLKDIFLPFGEPEVTALGDIIDNSLPSWVKKVVQAVGAGDEDMQRIRANTTMEVAGMMVRRGEGSFATPEEMKATLDAASKKSGWLYMIRAFASAAGPASPVFQYNSEIDKSGAWFYTNTMANKWSEMVKEHDGDTVSAFDEFTGLYGLSPQTYMQGKTKSITPHPLTEEAYAWKKENQDLYKQFPGTANLLNPVNPVDDEFSYDAYVESLREGSRVALTTTEWAEKQNQLAANIIVARFSNAAEAFMRGSEDTAIDQMKVDEQLYALQYQLSQEYEGYGRQITGSVAKMSPEERYGEIERWTPEMKATPGGEAIMMYMAARDEAEALSLAGGHSPNWWTTSPDAAHIRDQVMAIATMIRAKHPAFRWAWVSLFSQELTAHREARKAA